jgi:hypothetical protein
VTIGYLWGIIGTIGFFAFTLVLEVVKLSRSLKSSDDELASARQKIATLNEKQDETIADLKKLHQRETEELRKEISHIPYLEEISIKEKLPEIQVNILKLLFTVEDIKLVYVADKLSINIQTARYHITELAKLSMATCQQNRKKHEANFSEYCKIEHLGRKYLLVDNRLA